jgi:hypothetical protein
MRAHPDGPAAGPAVPPPAEQAVLREEVRAILRRHRRASIADVRRELAALRWPPPEAAALLAAVDGDPEVHRLPDGSLLHLGVVLSDRTITAEPPTAVGTVRVDAALTTLLHPHVGQDRVPVRAGGTRGWAELAIAWSGDRVLVLPPHVVESLRRPEAAELLGIVVEAEGWRLLPVEADPPSTAALRCALHRDRRTRDWSPADRLLAALADDPVLCRAPTTPPSGLLAAPLATLPARDAA